MDNQQREDRNEFLRQCVPGEEHEFECSDNRTRSVEVAHRIEQANGGVILKADGHGTRYQIDVPSPDYEAATASLRWPSGFAFVRKATLVDESERIWSDTTAEDLGIPGQ